MPRLERMLLLSALAIALPACGDDGGGMGIDANQTGVDASQQVDAPLNGIDAAPPIDATPLPPDSSTAGRACSFPDTAMLSDAQAVGTVMVCFDPATGNSCRVIEQGQISCFNDQVGFAFGIHNPTGMRSIAGRDGVTITGATHGTINMGRLVDIDDNTAATVTGTASTGQSFTIGFQYNGNTLSLPNFSGPN